MLKQILYSAVLIGIFSIVSFGQRDNDRRNTPPKEKPPEVRPKEKDRPRESPPPKDSNPERGNRPKKPDTVE
jgi:hypothetical protein